MKELCIFLGSIVCFYVAILVVMYFTDDYISESYQNKFKEQITNKSLIIPGGNATEIIIDGETYLIKDMCINGFQHIMLKNDKGHSLVPIMENSKLHMKCK